MYGKLTGHKPDDMEKKLSRSVGLQKQAGVKGRLRGEEMECLIDDCLETKLVGSLILHGERQVADEDVGWLPSQMKLASGRPGRHA